MKISKLVFLGALICFSSNLFSQTESSSLIKTFGIGLHIEQFKLSDVGDLNIAPANKIIFAISPSHSFRLEPEFGFKFGKNKTSDIKNSSIYLGMGALGMIQRNKLNIYGGLRFEYAIIKDGNSYTYNGTTTTSTTNRVTIGPAMGCEYYLGDNFAFGGEIALKYASLKTSIDPNPANTKEQESNYFTTDTGLFIRFYF
jgi:hypothetical protein